MAFRISDLFSNYLRHNDINDYLDFLAQKYPETVTVSNCGNSYEGRPLKSIRISNNETVTARQQVFNRSTKSRSMSKSSKTSRTCNKSKSKGPPKDNNSQIKSLNKTSSTKPVILIDGGIHAREWISVATALYVIHQLTEKSSRYVDVLGRMDFVIIPIVNVDGYEYTHTNVSVLDW